MDRTFKICLYSLDATTSESARFVYKSVGQLQPSWTGQLIENWQSEIVASSVVQVPLSGICDHEIGEESDLETVKLRVYDLNEVIPIYISADGKSIVICPLFYDHAKSI